MAHTDNLYGNQGLSRRWVWKEETNTLEAVITNPNLVERPGNFSTSAAKSKRNKGQLGIHFQSDYSKKNDRGTPSVMSRNVGVAGVGSRRGQAYLLGQRTGNMKGSSPRPSIKAGTSEHLSITLDDVKSVAFDSLPDVDSLPEVFQSACSTEQFDEFLLAVLNYFDAFFERLAIENKPKPMAVEPSLAEMKALATAIAKEEAAQKLLSKSYCVMVLGLGLEDQHHMACGRSRVSSTAKDGHLYEFLYRFSSYVTYITFRRQHLDLIHKELGRMFRSETFNPAGRPKEIKEVYAMDRLRDSNKKPLTPAEYRRLKPRRPAIKSIINQRSPVLVSLFPSSKEASPWFLDRTKAIPVSADELPNDDDKESLVLKAKVGIIGEAMSGFNPLTLAPFGEEEHDETGDDEDETGEGRRKSLAGDDTSIPPQGSNNGASPEEEQDELEEQE
ncbi:protein phosphatase 1 regulatory subunit 36-like [Actinia tenebrosa]|uniref:Protein phosphatase 1 regulatory subunit 36-like n=1 Tax=Actinia tenebrosa TaxID=6105 RepID=A0A6P8HFN8_ACTTE|nr:protein phosphatase 1 regulatory subunit 36-like [Actinia tenebrosa]